MKYLFVFILTLVAFVSCNKEVDSCVYAYVGGEIINPNSEFIILEHSNGIIDTLHLNKNNRFLKKIEKLSPGIHTFIHGGEYQVAILEHQDSLMVRLNTLDFDESIVFSGIGSKKNNYLIKLFLDIEEENNKMIEISRLDPQEFSDALSVQVSRRLDYLDQFASKYNTSSVFNEVAKATINYNFYANKEMYPFRNYGDNNVRNYTSLPENFYAYRENVDYNNDELKNFYPYYSFLFSHFNNLALDGYFKNSIDSIFKRRSLLFNMERIRLMDSLIKHDSIKNVMLKYAVRDFLNYSKNAKESKALVASYLEKSTDDSHKKYISELTNALENMQVGKELPNIKLVNIKNEIVNLNDIINKTTVISFWSSAIKSHFKDNHKRIRELKSKYPNIDFISVNINANNNNVWKQMLRQYKFPMHNEFKFANAQEAKKDLALNYINKVILIDKDHVIIHSNANMFNMFFEDSLKAIDTYK